MAKLRINFNTISTDSGDEHQELVRRLWLMADVSQYLLKELLKANKLSLRKRILTKLFQNEKEFAIELLKLNPHAND